ncbi:hypothetical protein VPH35_011900 [Triticum aestivum]
MLLEKLVPPSTLRKLKICGYNSVIFPGWVVGQLPNLKSLVLRDMANLEEWDTSYSTGEENVLNRVDIHGCPMLRMKGPLPKAKQWEIRCSDNVLSSWDECIVSHTSTSSSSSTVTTWLSVRDCKGPHQWRWLQHFPGLPSLDITNCCDLTSSPEINQQLSSLQTLSLRDLHMEELPIWLGELPSLKNLEISGSDGVKELNENMRQLIKLESLELSFCKSISVSHWLGELTSLKELCMNYNFGLRSLPASIQQLTILQEITLEWCIALEHVVAEPEEGKMKLTHNQEMVCLLPTSLRKLKITGCISIKSLPEGMQQLTNLQELEIVTCPGLKQWYELEENKMKLAHIEEKSIWF